jgi:hypothetical protein
MLRTSHCASTMPNSRAVALNSTRASRAEAPRSSMRMAGGVDGLALRLRELAHCLQQRGGAGLKALRIDRADALGQAGVACGDQLFHGLAEVFAGGVASAPAMRGRMPSATVPTCCISAL